MCNFIIRPIKSYATVDIRSDETTTEIEAGQAVTVKYLLARHVVVEAENIAHEKYEVQIPIEAFTHGFTANPDDIKKVKDEEYKTMGYNPNKK